MFFFDILLTVNQTIYYVTTQARFDKCTKEVVEKAQQPEHVVNNFTKIIICSDLWC